jgi:hypothetical protein
MTLAAWILGGFLLVAVLLTVGFLRVRGQERPRPTPPGKHAAPYDPTSEQGKTESFGCWIPSAVVDDPPAWQGFWKHEAEARGYRPDGDPTLTKQTDYFGAPTRWTAHGPVVPISFELTPEAQCPYCGTWQPLRHGRMIAHGDGSPEPWTPGEATPTYCRGGGLEVPPLVLRDYTTDTGDGSGLDSPSIPPSPDEDSSARRPAPEAASVDRGDGHPPDVKTGEA